MRAKASVAGASEERFKIRAEQYNFHAPSNMCMSLQPQNEDVNDVWQKHWWEHDFSVCDSAAVQIIDAYKWLWPQFEIVERHTESNELYIADTSNAPSSPNVCGCELKGSS